MVWDSAQYKQTDYRPYQERWFVDKKSGIVWEVRKSRDGIKAYKSGSFGTMSTSVGKCTGRTFKGWNGEIIFLGTSDITRQIVHENDELVEYKKTVSYDCNGGILKVRDPSGDGITRVRKGVARKAA